MNTGYDVIHMSVESSNGAYVELKRKIVDGPKGDKGDSKIDVIASPTDIRLGLYTKGDFNDMMLRAMGINEAHKIIAYKDIEPENLSLRYLAHMFFLDENVIFTDKPVIDNPKYSKNVYY